MLRGVRVAVADYQGRSWDGNKCEESKKEGKNIGVLTALAGASAPRMTRTVYALAVVWLSYSMLEGWRQMDRGTRRSTVASGITVIGTGIC